MAPPSVNPDPEPSDGAAVAGRVAEFGAELAGVLRRASIIDLLIQHVGATFTPSVVAVALHPDDRDPAPAMHVWPAGAACPPELLDAGEAGPRFVSEGGASWCVAPLRARGRITGGIAVRDPSGQFAGVAPRLLEALASQASVALESAHLVDFHDESRRSWQEIVDALTLALCIVDGEGRIRRANRAFAQLVDAPPAAVVGRSWATFIPPEWTGPIQRVIDAGGHVPDIELRTLDRAFSLSGVPLTEGDSSGVVLLFEDHTERRQLQDKLLQSTKLSAMGQLIAGVAHELNNPLASVVGFADFLAEMPDVPPALREPLAVIRDEAERASTIVRNLLSFARKQESQRRPMQIGPIIDSTMSLLRNPLLAQRVEARVDIESDLPQVRVDPNQIQQVIVNLVNNAGQAIAASGRPGTVLVRARRFLDDIAIDVVDDGPGMTEEIASQVFDSFFTTKGHEGTGLGIPISQGIVKEHGGRITLETAPGQGATFTVNLPLATGAHPSEPLEPARPPAHRLRVLVVDDEPHILHYMSATLSAWGHEVAVADDGDTGLELATEGNFDLIITDLRMPRLGGREFFDTLCTRRPDLANRVFFSTGDTVRGDTLAFLELLDRPYLHKPFSLSELRTLLATGARSAELREGKRLSAPDGGIGAGEL